MKQSKTIVAAGLICVCFLLRQPLESDPVTHVLVQLPALAVTGALFAPIFSVDGGAWNRGGIPTLLVALFAIVFWMLPSSIDSALTSPVVEAAKFVSVPFLIGVPLAMGWKRAHPLLRGFIKAQAISMLGILAFLYTHAPVRICNAYLVGDQERLGYGFLFAALGVSLLWIIPLFNPQSDRLPENLRVAEIR